MDWREFAKQEAIRQGVDPSLVLPLVGVESNWNSGAVSPKGAAGLMQLMPATARDLGLSEADRFNPARAIPAGVRYLKQQLDTFGSPDLALAAYNAGPGAVKKAGGVPNYPETQNYVRKNAMADKTTLSVDDLVALAGQAGKQPSRSLSVDDLVSLAGAKKPSQNFAPSDPLEGYNVGQRALIGAGKAATNLLHGIGIGDALGLTRGDEKADAALDSDTAATAGNILGQAGMMYAGGRLISGAGSAIKGAADAVRGLSSAITPGMRLASSTGQALSTAGKALYSPQTASQAAAAGAAYGAASQPGNAADRAANAATGAAGGAAGFGIGKLLNAGGSAIANRLTSRPSPIDLDQTINLQLQANGLDLSALPRAAQQSIRQAAKEAISKTGKLDPSAVQRLADLHASGVSNPLKGWVTRDPAQWWEADTLNTVDPRISQRYLEANRALLEGARQGVPDATDYQLGDTVRGTVQGQYDALKGRAGDLYNQAREMAGRDIGLDPHRFVNNASAELDQAMIGSELPSDTLNWFQKITSGKEPFDMGTALQRLQALNGRIYSTKDAAQAKALGIVKSHLMDAIEGYGGAGAEQQAMGDAFKSARGAASEYIRFQKNNPLVDSVISGKFSPETMPDLMGRMKADDLTRLGALDQQYPDLGLVPKLRDAASAYIRDASVLQSETGGKFTVAGLRKALDRIGPEKGRLLFGGDWDRYQALLRAGGSIMNAPDKPSGSSTAPNLMRWLARTPVLGMPTALQLIGTGAGKVKQAMNVNQLLQPGLYSPSAVPTLRGLIMNGYRSASPMPVQTLAVPGLLDIINKK